MQNAIEVEREQKVRALRDAYGTLQDVVDATNKEIAQLWRDVVNPAVDAYNAKVREVEEWFNDLDCDAAAFQPDQVSFDCPQIEDCDDECLAALELEDLEIECPEDDED